MKENKLFYGSMQAHERAYKDQRADEAKNDMILGAQVNSLVQMEEAKERSANDIANRYGAFLKQLRAKDIPLKNLATDRENKLAGNPRLVISQAYLRKLNAKNKTIKPDVVLANPGLEFVGALPSSDPSDVVFTDKSAERAAKDALVVSIKEAQDILNGPGLNKFKYNSIGKRLGSEYREAISSIATGSVPNKKTMQKAITMIKTKNMLM